MSNRKFSLVVFIIIFATIGVYLLFRSFAQQAYGIGAKSLVTSRSANATLITETTASSKKNATVVKLTGPGATAVLYNSQNTIPAGIYQMCLYARSAAGTSSGSLSIAPTSGSSPTAASVAYSLAAASDYNHNTCISGVTFNSAAAPTYTVTDTGGGNLRVSTIILTKTGDTSTPPPPPASAGNCDGSDGRPAGYSKLAFCDDFSSSALNTSKWSYGWFSQPGQLSGPVNGAEDDCYKDSLTNPGTANDGTQTVTVLKQDIVAASSSCKGSSRHYQTGYVTTMNQGGNSDGSDLYHFTYGYAEARMYIPADSNGKVANWPAWWLQSLHDYSGPAPYTEIDIMEGLSGNAAWHVHGLNNTDCGGGSGAPGWHTYAVDWKPGTATFYYDGKNVGTCNNGDLNSDKTGAMRLILGEQTGQYGGAKVAPQTMMTDYVRVWQ